MKKTFYIFLSLLSLGMFAGAANATLFTFSLADSVAGGERPPNYGLRLDGLYSGNSTDIYTFSFVDVGMTVDSDADTVFLGGTLLGGSVGAGEARNINWFFEFLYTEMVIDDSDGSWEFAKGTSNGSGSITNDVTDDNFLLAQFMGSDGFGPDGGGGINCRTGDGPWCGNGWLNHSVTAGAAVSSTHYYSSDFLYNGTPSAVPEPSISALFGLGLAGLGFARRRRQS